MTDKCKVERAVRLGREYLDVRAKLLAVRHGLWEGVFDGPAESEQELESLAERFREEIAALGLSDDERHAVMEAMKAAVKLSRTPESARDRTTRPAGT